MRESSEEEIYNPKRSSRNRKVETTLKHREIEIVHERKAFSSSFSKNKKQKKDKKLKNLFEDSEEELEKYSEESDFDYDIDDELFEKVFGRGNEYKFENEIQNYKPANQIKEKEEKKINYKFSDDEIINFVKRKYNVSDDVIIALNSGINVNYVSFYRKHNTDIHQLYEIKEHINKYKNYKELVQKCEEINSEFDYFIYNDFTKVSNYYDFLKMKIKDKENLIGNKILSPFKFLENLKAGEQINIVENGDFNLSEEFVDDYARKVSKSPIFYEFYERKLSEIKDLKEVIQEITRFLNILNNKFCLKIIQNAVKMIYKPQEKIIAMQKKIFDEIFSSILSTSFCKLRNEQKCGVFIDFEDNPELNIFDSKYNFVEKLKYNKAFTDKNQFFITKNNPEFIVFVGNSRFLKMAFEDLKENNPNTSMFFYFSKYFNLASLSPKIIAKLVTIPEIEFYNQIDLLTKYFKIKQNLLNTTEIKKVLINSFESSIAFCGLDYNYNIQIGETKIFKLLNCFQDNFNFETAFCEVLEEYKELLSLSDIDFLNFSTYFRIFYKINENAFYEPLDSTIIHPEFYQSAKNLLSSMNISESHIVENTICLQKFNNFYTVNKISMNEKENLILPLLLFKRPKYEGATNEQVFDLLINFDKKYLNTRFLVNIRGGNKKYSYADITINNKKYPVAINDPNLSSNEGSHLIEITDILYDELTISANPIMCQDFSTITSNALFDANLNYASGKEKLLNTNHKVLIVRDILEDRMQLLCKIGENSVKTFNIQNPTSFTVDGEIFTNFKEFMQTYFTEFLENIKKIYASSKVFSEKIDVFKFFSKSENTFCFFLTPGKEYDMLIFKNGLKNKYKVTIGRKIKCKNECFSEIKEMVNFI